MSQENLEELAKLFGEDNVRQSPKYIVPMLRLHGNKGVFEKTILTEDDSSQTVEMDNKIEGVMLKVRRAFSAFAPNERLYTNEHNSWKDKVTLFQSRKTEKGWRTQRIDEGMIKELREKYPTLRMRQQIYFLLFPVKEIVKLTVKGKGLGNLFEYWSEFKPNEHSFQFLTKIGTVEEQGPGGNKYYAMTFKRETEELKDEDANLVAEKIREVAENVARIEMYYAEYTPPEAEVARDEAPVVSVDEELPESKDSIEDIKSEDIPF